MLDKCQKAINFDLNNRVPGGDSVIFLLKQKLCLKKQSPCLVSENKTSKSTSIVVCHSFICPQTI